MGYNKVQLGRLLSNKLKLWLLFLCSSKCTQKMESVGVFCFLFLSTQTGRIISIIESVECLRLTALDSVETTDPR